MMLSSTMVHPVAFHHTSNGGYALGIFALFFIASDVQRLLFDSNMKWVLMYGVLVINFYVFSLIFQSRELQKRRGYVFFSFMYMMWLFIAGFYRLPSFQSIGVSAQVNISLFLFIFVTSVLALVALHCLWTLTRRLGIVGRYSNVPRSHTELLSILKNSFIIGIGCSVYYTHCGNEVSDPRSQELHEFKNALCDYISHMAIPTAEHPAFKLWAFYGSIVRDTNVPTADEERAYFSPLYSLWITYISMYVTHYLIVRSTGWAITHQVDHSDYEDEEETDPNFLPMVPWYTLTSADMLKTGIDVLISVKVFLGRFDVRSMMAVQQSAATGSSDDGLTYKHFAENGRDELWFDWVADVGDGGNSTYTIARALAQPKITVDGRHCGTSAVVLPRASLLIIGGDLAYPTPNRENYESRLFKPYEYAMEPPTWYCADTIATKKPDIGPGESLADYSGPQCFAIPGNHDYFDGLESFIRLICRRSWLGGWLMPQERSYWSLKLPHNWWIFGVDLALEDDIDMAQFLYFARIADDEMGPDDRCIVTTHEPTWIQDWYFNQNVAKNLEHLIIKHLRHRVSIRLAGDLHHYMRFSRPSQTPRSRLNSLRNDEFVPTTMHSKRRSVSSADIPETAAEAVAAATSASIGGIKTPYMQVSPIESPHLIVSGGGGAFCHATHMFRGFSQITSPAGTNVKYTAKAVFPSYKQSSRMAFDNILNFRKMNWRFDMMGGLCYFLFVGSLLPLCHNLDPLLEARTLDEYGKALFTTLFTTLCSLFTETYLSLISICVVAPLSIAFVAGNGTFGPFKKVCLGLAHFSVHLVSAVLLIIVMEIGIEICVRSGVLGSQGWYSLYNWYRKNEAEQFKDPDDLRGWIEDKTFGIYPALFKWVMTAFDVPDTMAVMRKEICSTGWQDKSRVYMFAYYITVWLYYWIIATPTVSFIFGFYLYVASTWFNISFDESYSSLRSPSYKSFLRFHITCNGDLEMFCVGVERTPRTWVRDPLWRSSTKEPSYRSDNPSMWTPGTGENCDFKIIDHLVVRKSEFDANAPFSSTTSTRGNTTESKKINI